MNEHVHYDESLGFGVSRLVLFDMRRGLFVIDTITPRQSEECFRIVVS